MKTLQLSGEKARILHKTGSPEMKELLEENFGKEFFSQSVMDRINDWEDMMKETGRPDVPEFLDVPEDLRPFFKATYRNIVMVESYNESKQMSIYDSNNNRYYPYFLTNGSASGFAFVDSFYVITSADAGCGSRLSFKKKEHAIHASKNHTDIFREMFES